MAVGSGLINQTDLPIFGSSADKQLFAVCGESKHDHRDR
jgi:hypothetical protein